MSRVTILGFLVPLLAACGADGGGAGLSQLAGEDALSLAGDATSEDVAVDATDDTQTGADTNGPADTVAPEDTAPGDTAVVEDTVVVADTAVEDTTVVADTAVTDTAVVEDTAVTDTTVADTSAPDTVAPTCQHTSDCFGLLTVEACHHVACVAGECVVEAVDGGWCDDGDPCTRQDLCVVGVCTPGSELLPCNDHDACTSDACVPGTGCVFTPITCEAPTNACKVAKCDPSFGCGQANAVAGTPCDDADACTVDDQCAGGHCAGAPMACDDQDPCTSDACVDGGCVSTAVVCDDGDPCTTDYCGDGVCHFDTLTGCGVGVCDGLDPGTECDDEDATTTADMCLGGTCRGFTATVVAPTPGNTSLVISEIDHAAGVWWSVFWTLDGQYHLGYAVANVSNPAAPVVADTSPSLLRGLGHGFVGDQSGHVRSVFSGWSTSNAWDAAVDASGRGAINALWANPDRTILWLLGQSNEQDWIRVCSRSGDEVSCSPQALDDFQPPSIPKAVAGLESACAPGNDQQSCNTRVLVTGADGPSSQNGSYFFKDAYENIGGAQGQWSQSFIPNTPTTQYTVTATAWGDGDFLIAGSGGFLRHRRPDGSWSNNLDELVPGMGQRGFSGAWAGEGVIILSASRTSNGRTYFELWTCPQSGDVESAASWTIHPLGDADSGEVVGLHDVRGDGAGELRAVGAMLKPGSGFLHQGLVYIRSATP